jgi:hypothetical protein
MKVCVTLVGVTRPSFTQVKENIENNITYFTKYSQHVFEFIVLTYKNDFSDELREYCSSKNIKCIFLEQFKDSDFIFPVKIKVPTAYRLFYSMNQVMNYVPKDACIVRVRLDTQVCNLELMEPEENVYYSLKESENNCSDNIGYGTYKTMRNIWKHENCLLRGMGMEAVVYSAIKKYNYRIKDVKYHYKLYQSSEPFCDGVRQWSKGNREWIYDGINYIKK